MLWVEEAQRRGFEVEHTLSLDDRTAAFAKANDRSIRNLGREEVADGRIARVQQRDGDGPVVLIAAKNSQTEYIRVDLTAEQATEFQVGDSVRVNQSEIERIQEHIRARDQEVSRER